MKHQRITPEQASLAFAACAGLDPEGHETPERAALAGPCFELATDTGTLAYTLSAERGIVWIHAAAGRGQGMTAAGLAVIEQQARAAQCQRVGFQTVRRGLVRRARALGYEITREIGAGYVLEKAIQ